MPPKPAAKAKATPATWVRNRTTSRSERAVPVNLPHTAGYRARGGPVCITWHCMVPRSTRHQPSTSSLLCDEEERQAMLHCVCPPVCCGWRKVIHSNVLSVGVATSTCPADP
eukprot:456129-Prymnesium_polylepis.2